MSDIDGLIKRLEDEGLPATGALLLDASVNDVLEICRSTDDPAAVRAAAIVEKWVRNRHRSQRQIRQRNRLQAAVAKLTKEVAERTGERNRARRDRDTLREWIHENAPNAQVEGPSGRYEIVTTTEGDPACQPSTKSPSPISAASRPRS